MRKEAQKRFGKHKSMNWLYDEQASRERGEQALAGLANAFLEELDAKREARYTRERN